MGDATRFVGEDRFPADAAMWVTAARDERTGQWFVNIIERDDGDGGMVISGNRIPGWFQTLTDRPD